ncbi:MAG: c-type cytochrome [Alphaproteobacteria bacterium]|nr:c-type cytochrome [Alphaproteobacteria bacterium]
MRASVAIFVLLTMIGFAAPLAAEHLQRGDLTPADLDRVRAITAPATDFSKAEAFEAMAGGAATSTKLVNRDAFSNFSANLTFEEEERFKLGNALFRKLWAAAPSSTLASDGLGPLFNARGCQSCHLKDGRGHPPEGDEAAVSMFLRLSVPARTEAERAMLAARDVQSLPDPVYGGQLQNFANPGLASEGRMQITYEDEQMTLGDGTLVTLRKPSYALADPLYGDPDPALMISPRVAPPMIGLGLLEAVPEEDVLALADPDDMDGDGVSGKPAWVKTRAGDLVLGRFGWKASMPSIRAQSAGAFSGDIGISSPDHPDHSGDCTKAQADCMAAPQGAQADLGPEEAPEEVISLVTFYSQNLAVPARRGVDDPQVLAGKALFYEIGCTACHNPKFVTSRAAEGPAQRFQLIWPYTDLLLHDMGEGLADHRPDGDADGYEWRTAPLWGIGLTETVSGHTLYLHDGRARNLTEAILWHGGEAEQARDGFAELDSDERDALLAFLGSL